MIKIFFFFFYFIKSIIFSSNIDKKLNKIKNLKFNKKKDTNQKNQRIADKIEAQNKIL